jgi:hypothetical protein
MLILSMLVQEIVTLERYAINNTYVGDSGAAPSHACEIAEQVIGRIAWDRFKNTEIKAMKELRKPMPRGTLGPYRAKRNKRIGGSLIGWMLETGLKYFEDVDIQWTMNDTLTWLSPDGDPAGTFSETLRHAISEAFWALKTEQKDAKITAARRSAAAKSSGSEITVALWSTDKSVNSKNDFLREEEAGV